MVLVIAGAALMVMASMLIRDRLKNCIVMRVSKVSAQLEVVKLIWVDKVVGNNVEG